ncbi:MAG: hypothetical protein ABUK01_07965 [Leptospirales bacterium]
MISVTLVTMALSMTISIYYSAFSEVNRVKQNSERVKSRYYAQSGLALAVLFLRRVSWKELYNFNLFGVPITKIKGDVQYTFTITEETGKLNLNALVNFFNDDVNLSSREMFDRLGENFGVPVDYWDAVIDWIDDNSVRMPGGDESVDYAAMTPPRRAKNSRLHSVEELLFIEKFNPYILFEDGRTKEEKEMYSKDFLSDAEQFAIDEDVDYILANNLTVYVPENPPGDIWKININSAPYHVVLSLSAFMMPKTARKILAARWENGGYFTKLDELATIKELQEDTGGGVTLFTEIKEKIVIRERIYKIVVEAQVGSQRAHVLGIYDVVAKKLILYLE